MATEKATVVSMIKEASASAILMAKIADHISTIADNLEVRSPEARSRSESQESLQLDGVNSYDVKAHTLLMSPMLTEDAAKEFLYTLRKGLNDIAKQYSKIARNTLAIPAMENGELSISDGEE